MGEYIRPGTEITDFRPDDTEDIIWISTSNFSGNPISLTELLEKIHEKWSVVDLDDLKITAEYVHTECLYYDRYDSGDYTNYLKIERVKST
jgi:hypothetical protein